MEETAVSPVDANNTIAVGTAEPLTDGIDDRKLFVDFDGIRAALPAGLPDTSQQ